MHSPKAFLQLRELIQHLGQCLFTQCRKGALVPPRPLSAFSEEPIKTQKHKIIAKLLSIVDNFYACLTKPKPLIWKQIFCL